jgi:hypothetical protein
MQVSTLRRVSQVAVIAAIVLFVGGIVAAANSIGPGKGGNLGAALLAGLLWCLAFGAAVTGAVSFVVGRRTRGGSTKRGFSVLFREADDHETR